MQLTRWITPGIGGSVFTVVTDAGGHALTLATGQAGQAVTIGGSVYSVATAEVGSLASAATAGIGSLASAATAATPHIPQYVLHLQHHRTHVHLNAHHTLQCRTGFPPQPGRHTHPHRTRCNAWRNCGWCSERPLDSYHLHITPLLY